MSLSENLSSAESEIKQANKTFHKLVQIAESFLIKNKYNQAAVSAQIAALYASYNHHGEFISPKIEEILRTIGSKTIEEVAPLNVRARNNKTVKHVLHVLTAAKDVGGDTRFVWRWIERDSGRSHSVALTSQMHHEVPQELFEAVDRTGGTVHVLDSEGIDVIQCAQSLRRISGNSDVIFLDPYPEDVVPLIAFGNKANLPPIIFVNQADHQFWIGVSISDLFVRMRDGGRWLSEKRRGISSDKMALLPIPLTPISRKANRTEAKKKIGISEDSVVLLSIARAVKYSPIREPSFAEAAVPILNKHRNAVLLVLGPAKIDQWQIGYERTQGRIIALGQRSDTRSFYEAADIYLDSFPFSSNTSLLEAGSYGLPLVSYFPYSKESDVLGAGTPGLERPLLRTENLNHYEMIISRLIEDKGFREKIGNKTKQEIEFMHSGEGWNRCLRELYQKIQTLPLIDKDQEEIDQSPTGELDFLLNRFYDGHCPLGWVIGWYARHLPFGLRVQLLIKVLKVDRSFSFSMFLPMWLGEKLAAIFSGWRRIPLIAQWLRSK